MLVFVCYGQEHHIRCCDKIARERSPPKCFSFCLLNKFETIQSSVVTCVHYTCCTVDSLLTFIVMWIGLSLRTEAKKNERLTGNAINIVEYSDRKCMARQWKIRFAIKKFRFWVFFSFISPIELSYQRIIIIISSE